MIFTFGKIKTPLRSFCHSYDETIKHIFLEHHKLPFLFLLTELKTVYKITNHILLILKLHVYKSRERGILELRRLINEIKKVKQLEKIGPKSCKETGTV